MGRNNNKFKNTWVNQTELGKSFGLSAVAVGKILAEAGLRDAGSKKATGKALEEGFATATPLKDGTPFFLWNKHKVKEVIAKDHKPLSKVDYWVNEVRKTFKEAGRLAEEGNDKIAYMMADFAYDEVPKDVLKEVKAKVGEDDLG